MSDVSRRRSAASRRSRRYRFVAWGQHGLFPEATEQSVCFGSYFAAGPNPLDDYLVFLVVGLLIGSFVAARLARGYTSGQALVGGAELSLGA